MHLLRFDTAFDTAVDAASVVRGRVPGLAHAN